jgi:hypothetical protein
MAGFERQQAITALMALATALFVGAGYPGAGRWRRRLRAAAILCFAIAVAAALVETGLWLAGGRF